MAFLLKSTRLIYTAVRFTGKRDFSRERRIFLLEWPKIVNLNASSARTAVSATAEAKVNQNEPDKVENLFFHLNRDMRYKNILTKDVQDVLTAVRERGELKDAQLILLLKCCSESAFMATDRERIVLAENIWNTAEELGVQFNINHYNSLLSVFLNNEHKFNIGEFFEILNNKNIEPNFMTYRLALKAYCQAGDIEGASKVLAKLKDLNYVLKEDDFSSLIQGHCEIGDFEKAKELLDVMQSRDLTPTSKSYVNLLVGYAKHGKIEELNKLLDKLSKDKVVVGTSDLLEVIYTLSVHNQQSHIDSLVERLNADEGKGLKSAKIIQKLLHNRNDTLALNIFEKTLSRGMSMDSILSRAKFIIKHFVMYRSSKEVLTICKYLDSKGWSNAALSYALREVLLNKHELLCLKFLNAMKNEGLEIRNHYYWPVIIKASKRGTFWMRDILQKLPRSAFMNSYETTHKVIFPNYVLRNQTDYDFLCGLGINRRLLNYCSFEKHLLQRDLEKAEYTINRQQVTTKRWKHTVNCLLSAFTHEQNDHQNFLSILYGFAHDFYYVRSFLQSNVVDDLEGQEIYDETENIFDYAIRSLAKRLKNEEVFTKLLEGMVERKMGISSTTADNIASSFQSEKIRDLATKLASPESSFQYDINLMSSKMWKIPSSALSSISDNAKDLVLKPSANASSLAEAVTPETSITDAMFFAVVLGHKGLVEAAFKILTSLASRNPDTAPQSAIDLFRCFLQKQSCNSAKVVFDALDLGPKMGIPEKDLHRILYYIQEGNNSGNAFHIYLERVKRYKNIGGCLPLMIKAAKERNFGIIRKVKNASSGLVSNDVLSSYYIIALASAGMVQAAKRLSDRVSTLKQRILYIHCEMIYGQSNAQVFENFLEVVKNIKDFDRGPLYKLLLRKYAENKDVEKALALCTAITEDEVPDYGILKEITPFRDDPTLQNLEKVANNLKMEIGEDQSEYSEPLIQQSSNREVEDTEVVTKAVSGNVSTVLKLLTKKPTDDLKSICTAFLENGKVEEFFQFLENLAREEKFTSISNCFNINALLPVLKDDSNFEKYKALALRCLEEGYVTTPLISLFVTCVKMPSRVSVGEVLVQQYSAHFQNVPFLEICEEAKTGGCEIEFYENFVKSENLKSAFPEYHHVMFNKLIKHHCTNDNLKKALQYLEMAVSKSAEKFIDKDIIHLLDEKLRKTGESFPHPELLPIPSSNSTC